MSAKVLFVDDDPNILAGFRRQLRKVFKIDTAESGREGLRILHENGPYAVVVSDLRMPGLDGIQFLSKVRELVPDTVRMMLTGNADLQTAIDAVNEGNIFRFLTKPCDPQSLVNAVSAGIRQYELVTAERELLEKTLRGSIKVLSEILEMINPEAFGRASRIAYYAKEIGKRLKVSGRWQLETAAALSQVGCVILPESALQKLYRGTQLSGEEKQLFDMHPFIGSDLISRIPRMQGVAEIIAYQEKNFDGSGVPIDTRRGEEIPIASRILKVVLDFDMLQAGGASKNKALEKLSSRDGRYDPDVLSALLELIEIESHYDKKDVTVDELIDGMILFDDIFILDGRLLVARGYKVTRTLRERLKNFAVRPGIKEPFRVLVPHAAGCRAAN